MVTIREVAKAAGVSVATASRALNGLPNVTKKTREKIEATALALDYVPHTGARNLTRQRTDTIGVILPDLFGEFFAEMIRGIDLAVQDAGKSLLLGNMHGSREETLKAIRAMRGRVDGLLILPPDSNAETIGDTQGWKIPTVLLNAQAKGQPIPFVAVNNYAGARLVTEHLIERGARAIVHIAGPVGNEDARERERGFRDVVRERLGVNDPVILPGDFRENAGQEAARRILEGDIDCDAVFAGNDVMAVDVLTELREQDVAVGRDMLIAGFDDIPLARYVMPRLTTVRSDVAKLGNLAAEKLLRLLNGDELGGEGGTIFTPTLAIRESTRGSL